jgi:hypothetical protein
MRWPNACPMMRHGAMSRDYARRHEAAVVGKEAVRRGEIASEEEVRRVFAKYGVEL